LLPNFFFPFSKAWVGDVFHQYALRLSDRALTIDLDATTTGTGVRWYGSLRAVLPPINMKSALRLRARNSLRSAPLVISREEPFLVVEPSSPITRVAKTAIIAKAICQ
jgi:hypothetical protein